MSLPKGQQDALELVDWFEKQPDRSTMMKDSEIAERLGWFVGGHKRSSVSGNAHGKKEPQGNAARVRTARRLVDRDDEGLFADHVFGTRRLGGGVHITRLSVRGTPDDATDLDSQTVAGTTLQTIRKQGQEIARQIAKWDALKAEHKKAGNIEKAIACSHASDDLGSMGRLSTATEIKLVEAGLLSL